MTYDMWHIEGGKDSLKISGSQLIRFGNEGVFKIRGKRMGHLLNESGNQLITKVFVEQPKLHRIW